MVNPSFCFKSFSRFRKGFEFEVLELDEVPELDDVLELDEVLELDVLLPVELPLELVDVLDALLSSEVSEL